MLSEKIESQILISTYDNLYLIYDGNKEYCLCIEKDNDVDFAYYPIKSTPIELMGLLDDDNIIRDIVNKPNDDKNRFERDLTFLQSVIKSNSNSIADVVLLELLDTLANAEFEVNEYGVSIQNDKLINEIENEKIINKIIEISDRIKTMKKSKIYLGNGTHGKIVQFTNNPKHKDGLYYERKDNETGNISYKLIGNILIHKLKLTYDKLKLFKPVATIEYTNTTTKQLVKIEKQAYEVIADNIIGNRLIDSNKQGIESLLNKIWVQGVTTHDFISAETDLLKDGFFIDEETGKVLSNNVFENFETSPEEVRKAIKLFNDLIKNRGTAIPNDCTVFRFMLWSPFGYCLKQLGFIEALYSLVLWGESDTSKTGSSVMFSYLYTDKETSLQKANTQSAIGTRLGENTFPLILDEAKDNLINPNDEEFNKNIVTDKVGRAVKNRTNNNVMDEFPAMRMTIRTLNPDLTKYFKGEFYKRHKVVYYDASMQIKNDDEKTKFNIKYRINSPNTVLHQLKYLGKAFADRFRVYLEKQSNELYDLEKLTIIILEDIEKEYGIKFNMNVKVIQKLTNQSRDTQSIIKSGLNKMFTTAYKIPYSHNGYMRQDFINAVNKGAIRWLDYQPRKDLFIIKIREFEQDISDIVGQHIPIKETMKLLNIKYDDNNGKKIKFKGNAQNCYRLDTYNLTYKLFDINIYSIDELEELEKEENGEPSIQEVERQIKEKETELKKLKDKIEDLKKKEQREAEADKILNAKPI